MWPQDGVTIRQNSFVELVRTPWEESTKVACLEEMWGEPGGPTGERQLGTFRIFYRPEVLPSTPSPPLSSLTPIFTSFVLTSSAQRDEVVQCLAVCCIESGSQGIPGR